MNTIDALMLSGTALLPKSQMDCSSSSEGTIHSTLLQARALETHLCSLRRTIHANPELPFQELATSRLAAGALEALGFTISTSVGGSGFIADKGRGKTIALRADMDALQINELNQVSYRSSKPNVMHACGDLVQERT